MIYDICIIGGGIVGLSAALKVLERKPSVRLCILEKENELASHQTGNNSGVIHSGIYYKPGSYKALNCLTGYKYLLDFCDQHGIPYDLCGKLIVASDKSELPALNNLYNRGVENGLNLIRRLDKEELIEFEPYASGIAGLHVPYTGIINYREVSCKIAEIIQHKFGAEIFTGTRMTGLESAYKNPRVQTNGKSIEAKIIVNTAGLHSDRIARMMIRDPGLRIIPFRGEYYKLKPEKEYLVKNLIYPVPDPRFPFLGVHFTRMIQGGVEAGPNAVLAFKREGYKKTDLSINDLWATFSWPGFRKVMLKYSKMGIGEYYRSFSKVAFTRALQKLIPDIQKEDIIPGGAGVRAQACDRHGNLLDDFMFAENDFAVNVLNAPSPAATASLAIGEFIADKIINRDNIL